MDIGKRGGSQERGTGAGQGHGHRWCYGRGHAGLGSPGGAPRGKRTRGERETDVLAPSFRSVWPSQPTFYFPALIRDK